MKHGWPMMFVTVVDAIAAAADSLKFFASLDRIAFPRTPPFGKGIGREHCRRRSQIARSKRRKAKARH